MSSFFYNDPFFSFFDNINEEVNNINNILGRSQRPRQLGAAPRNNSTAKSESGNTKEVSKRENGRGLRTWADPFFGNSLFDFGYNETDIVPPVDIVTKEKSYELHVSIPGAPKDQVSVDFNEGDNELVIKGTIPSTKPETNTEATEKDQHYIERTSGKFERRITLPEKVDGEQIKATFENGVLKLEVPKVENSKESKYKRIAISSSESYSS